MPPTLDPQKQFDAKAARFAELFEAGNIGEMVDLFYSEDAVLEGPGTAPQIGREPIKAVFEEVRNSCSAIRIQLDPIIIGSELAYGCQTNINTRIDGEVEIHRGLMVWRRVGDEWFVVQDFFFTNVDAESALISGEFLVSLPI